MPGIRIQDSSLITTSSLESSRWLCCRHRQPLPKPSCARTLIARKDEVRNHAWGRAYPPRPLTVPATAHSIQPANEAIPGSRHRCRCRLHRNPRTARLASSCPQHTCTYRRVWATHSLLLACPGVGLAISNNMFFMQVVSCADTRRRTAAKTHRHFPALNF